MTAYALTGDLGDAEEIAQETYAIAYDRRRRVAGLRDTLAQRPRPDLRDVVERAHRRRTRRRTQLATVLVVALIAVAIPVLRGTTASPPATPSRPSVSVPRIDFFDASHGFALWTTCADATRPVDCTTTFQVTEDGRTWHRRALPGGGVGTESTVHALGPRTVAIEQDHVSVLLVSPDAGQTWTETPRTTDTVVDQIPANALLTTTCDRTWQTCGDNAVAVIDPVTGRTARLRTQPPFQPVAVQRLPDATGTWWAFGLKDTAEWETAASHDNGRSWQAGTATPTGVHIDDPTAQVVTDGTALTMAVWGARNETLVVFMRSTDGGKNWVLVCKLDLARGSVVKVPLPAGGPDAARQLADKAQVLPSLLVDVPLTPDQAGRWTRAGFLFGPSRWSDRAYPYRLSSGQRGEVPYPS